MIKRKRRYLREKSGHYTFLYLISRNIFVRLLLQVLLLVRAVTSRTLCMQDNTQTKNFILMHICMRCIVTKKRYEDIIMDLGDKVVRQRKEQIKSLYK